ncbi:hypothetical protein BCR33DRAFT_739110 [Rhizoclosmatium globosum]|uniref:Transcription factor domain-containing protein n=1 Tax=Rhizoclosmatium globosum TaxID=329046 RepID=A0A1Y2C682_9FUNG|nr:hypothetical protein BCR33DRAFT_739110 [Rhizoclosmatium globosum]|eukprot:ORY42548.1 hypothetical protein BCR33DRAFT_739110 [Rhizoclosmatium globosum]
MIRTLRLDVDPNEAIWLPENLSEAEKEEYRRTFWVSSVYCKIHKLSNGLLDSDLTHPTTPNSIMYQIEESTQTAPIVYLYHLLDVTADVLRYVTRTSSSNVLDNTPFTPLQKRLDSWHATVPPILHLEFSDPNLPAKLTGVETSCRTLLNLFYHSTVCQLHRLRLYLSKSCTVSSTPQLTISLVSVFQSAHHISNIARILLPLIASDPELYFYSYIPFFEAAVSLWFLACRSRGDWIDEVLLATGGVGLDAEETESDSEVKQEAFSRGTDSRRTYATPEVGGGLEKFYRELKYAVQNVLDALRVFQEKMERNVVASKADLNFMASLTDEVVDHSLNLTSRVNFFTPLVHIVQVMVAEIETVCVGFEVKVQPGMEAKVFDIPKPLVFLSLMFGE